MNILSNFIQILCEVFTILILIRVIISWFSSSSTNRFVIFIYQVTDLLLAPLRRIIPRVGMIDFTPLVAIVLLRLIVIPLS